MKPHNWEQVILLGSTVSAKRQYYYNCNLFKVYHTQTRIASTTQTITYDDNINKKYQQCMYIEDITQRREDMNLAVDCRNVIFISLS